MMSQTAGIIPSSEQSDGVELFDEGTISGSYGTAEKEGTAATTTKINGEADEDQPQTKLTSKDIDIFSPLDIEDFEPSLKTMGRPLDHQSSQEEDDAPGVNIIEEVHNEMVSADDEGSSIGNTESEPMAEKNTWGQAVARRTRDMIAGLCTTRCGMPGQQQGDE